ncbi:hypothetical protein ACQPX6_22265 [Actinomycetospora sp. CA-101289]|uniref:hypothetical protein n=1 Tax=Actinomycetospora sp. CA-101289 TaxID=3239893 RepID=UPI003D97DEC6
MTAEMRKLDETRLGGEMLGPRELRASVEPERVLTSLAEAQEDLRSAGSPHVHQPLTDIRTANHRGHEIIVRTSYEIEVDGSPFDVALIVGDDGHVHYHGLPTQNFSSAIDLVRAAIDVFGAEDLVGGGHAGHGHGEDDHGGHAAGHGAGA